MPKTAFATKCQELCHNQSLLANQFKDIYSIYFDRTYNSGGADEITDADLEAFEFDAATLAGVITLSEQLDKMLNNQAVAQADYDQTLNKMRKVSDLNRRPY